MSTPRLQEYLNSNNLSEYNQVLQQLGFISVDKISCIPPEEDTYFVKELNINGHIDRIKFRTMINEIRRDIKYNTNIIESTPKPKTNAMIYHNTNTNNNNNNNNTNNTNTNVNDDSNSNVNDIIHSPNWSCSICTFHNLNNSTSICEMCESINAHKTPLKSSEKQESYFMELKLKYGTKPQYKIDEQVIFFIPVMADKGEYIDRSGIIQSKISNNEYKIADDKSNCIYTVPFKFILKLNENSNNNETAVDIDGMNDNNDIVCGMCDKIMDKLFAKDVYNGDGFVCDGIGCNKIVLGTHIVYHCNNKSSSWHGQTYGLCTECVHKKCNKRIKEAASAKSSVITWKQWEIDFILNCQKEYKNQNIRDSLKHVAISQKLSEHTEIMRGENEPDAPWRTSSAVKIKLSRYPAKKRKKYEKKSNSYETGQPSKKRRKS